MTVQQITQVGELPSSILESETAPSLDRLLAQFGHRLPTQVLREVRHALDITEDLICRIDEWLDAE